MSKLPEVNETCMGSGVWMDDIMEDSPTGVQTHGIWLGTPKVYYHEQKCVQVFM